MAKLSAGKLDKLVILPLGKDDIHFSMSKPCFFKNSCAFKISSWQRGSDGLNRKDSLSLPPHLPIPKLLEPVLWPNSQAGLLAAQLS